MAFTARGPAVKVLRGAAAGALVLAASSAGALHACTIVDGLEVPKPSVFAPCVDAAASTDRVYAVRSIAFDVAGFDAGDPRSCPPVQAACKGARPGSASLCGNRGGEAISDIRDTYALADRLNADIERGRGGVLVRVQGYNGCADDPSVVVSLYPSLGVYAGGAPSPARWNGDDVWELDRTSLANVERKVSRYFGSGTALGGVVVARMDGASTRVSGDFQLSISDASLSVRFEGDGGVGGALLVGRWGAQEAYQGLRSATFTVGDASTPICAQPILDKALQGYVCNARDLPPADAGATAVPCETVSLAFRMTLVPAKLGDARDPPPFGAPCEPDGGAPTPINCP